MLDLRDGCFSRKHRQAAAGTIRILVCLILGLSLTFGTAVSLSGCRRGEGGQEEGKGPRGGKGDKDKKAEPEEFLTPVIAARVERGSLLVSVSVTANVIPVRSESMQTMESGIVVYTKAWEEGDFVTSGTLIATLDNEDLRKELDTSKADLEIQRQNLGIQTIRLRQAEREYVITQDLYARGLAPLRDVESSKLALENSRNSLSQSKINLEKGHLALGKIEKRFEFLEIRAPFTGILVSRSTIEGRSGLAKSFGFEPLRSLEGRFINRSTALFGIMDTSRTILRCDVTSKDIAKVHVGQMAQGIVYGRENIDVEGEVVKVSTNVNPDTRAFEVDVLVDNSEGRLRPGMFGRMEIVTQQLLDVIAVPKAIVQQRGEEDIIFAVERPPALPHPIAVQVPVELGVESKDSVEVTFGLKNGDEIVVRGYEILQDRIPIQVAYDDEPTT